MSPFVMTIMSAGHVVGFCSKSEQMGVCLLFKRETGVKQKQHVFAPETLLL